MNNNDLTIVIITLNEAHNLDRFFESIEGWVSNVVVLDSFSSDNTVDICLSKGAKVFQRKFDNFGSQWNVALTKTNINTSWVMKMDPDEVMTDEVKNNINTAISDSKFDAFNIEARLFFMGKPLPKINKVLRIWRNGDCKFSDSLVNEYPIVNGSIGDIKGVYEHHDSPNLNHWLNKQNKYTASEAEVLVNQLNLPIKPNIFGNADQRRMFFKKHFYSIPFRFQILFLYHYFILGAFKVGKIGLVWSRLRTLVYYLIELKAYELKQQDKLEYQLLSDKVGKPDERCKQI
tara:strand:- start:11931 stop:12797 length:867 start_codon:yes stop_codon:yes gene_type:complete